MIFVIFHGVFGGPEDNWYPYLRDQLEMLDQTVIMPRFPVDIESELIEGVKEPGEQTLEKWLSVIEPIQESFPKGEKLCFVGHSLGCICALRAIEKYKLHLDSAIFVSAFLDCLPTEVWPYTTIIRSFQKTDFDPVELKELVPTSYVLYSDTDPFVPNRQSIVFAQMLDAARIPVRGAGHMGADVNLNEFSLVFDLCLTRLDLSYAQKHQLLRLKTSAFEYVLSCAEGGEISFEPKAAMRDKLFLFQNVTESGFATLYPGLMSFQLPHSPYMESARRKAGLMKRFDRVILLTKKSELRAPDLLEQIRADLKSGIHIYLCWYDRVRSEVPEPDFGIWDARYVVINPLDGHEKEPKMVKVSSTRSALDQAGRWKKIIMKQAFEVKQMDTDIPRFLKTPDLK